MRYDPKDLGNRLQGLLYEQEISRKNLCMSLDLSKSILSRIINGDRNLTLKNLDKICKLLETTPNYLIYGMCGKKTKLY